MKYLVATFTIETTADLMQASQDLLADGAAEAGFESLKKQKTDWKRMCRKNSSTRRCWMPILLISPSGIRKLPTR